MFTLSQIKSAHSKVKSGADFPAYIGDLKTFGVVLYETFVDDGHTVYYGADNYSQSSPVRPDRLQIAPTVDIEQFKADLLAHQQGHTDYPSFCRNCAKSGIAKWAVSTNGMTCTYFDLANHKVLVENIPE